MVVKTFFDLSNCACQFSKEVVGKAMKDWAGIRREIKKSKCRRVSPEDSMPNEVWRLIFQIQPEFKVHSLNGENRQKRCIRVRQMFFQFLCVLRSTNVAPISWHHSQAFSLPKKDPSSVKYAFDSQRMIHTLDPIGKHFYKHVIVKAGAVEKTLPCEFAYIKGRRREAALKQQLIVGQRLSRNHISYTTTSYDMKNAFGSIDLDVMINVFQYLILPEDWLLFVQRVKYTSTRVPALGEVCDYKIGSGPLPGDKIAAERLLL